MKQQRVVVAIVSIDCRRIIDKMMSRRFSEANTTEFNYDIQLFPSMCGMYLNVQGLTRDAYEEIVGNAYVE